MKILCNQSLQEKYQEWAQATLDNMINAPIMVLQTPLCLLQKDALLVLLINDQLIQPEDILLDLS